MIEALAGRIAARDGELNAFTALDLDRARAEAAEAERRYAAGAARPLDGLPLAVKDLFDTAGLVTAYGSAIFADHVPAADAEAVRRAHAAGAIVVGKTLTHEFAWGITSDNPHFGPCRNPWAPDRVPGGSSGGSAVAVAAGLCPLALGTDTGGSIRIPAAFCGVAGMKPTFGRVSVAGTFPLAPSLDHVGPLARTPGDARLLLAAIAGPDPADPASVLAPPGDIPPAADPEAALAGRRIAVCRDLHLVEPAPEVEAALGDAVAAAAALGAEIVELPFPAAGEIVPTYVTIQLAEALWVHRSRGLYPQRKAEYGADVRRRLEAAEAVGLDDYLTALAARGRVRAGFATLFERADLLLTPVSAGPPVRIGEHAAEHLGRRVAFRDLVMGYTMPQDLAGLPACALRAGTDALGIPIGVQLTGPVGADGTVLDAAEALAATLGAAPGSPVTT